MNQVGTIINAPGIERLSDYERWLMWSGLRARGINPDYVATVISIESGFDPSIENPNGGASGLVQVYSDKTAQRYGYADREEIRASTAADQIKNLVNKWTWPKTDDPGEVYLSLFFPSALGWPDSQIIGAYGSDKLSDPDNPKSPSQGAVYAANAGFDPEGSGIITAGMVRDFARKRYAANSSRPRIPVYDDAPIKETGGKSVPWALVIAGGVLAGLLGIVWLSR